MPLLAPSQGWQTSGQARAIWSPTMARISLGCTAIDDGAINFADFDGDNIIVLRLAENLGSDVAFGGLFVLEGHRPQNGVLGVPTV